MNFKKFLTFTFIALIASMVFYSCSEDEGDLSEVTVDLTEENRNFLFNTSAARSKARTNGVGGPAGFIFRLGNGLIGRNGRTEQAVSPLMAMRAMMDKSGKSPFTAGRVASDTIPDDGGEDDFPDEDDDDFLPDCVTESYTENEDGSYEYILDFGDGCDFFGEFFKGKLIERGANKDNSFSGTTIYENFGTDFWEMNGTYTYEGVFEIPTDFEDSLDFDWSAEFSYAYDMVEKYTDDEETFMVDSEGSGKERADEDGYTVLEQESSFDYGSGESFSSKVESPLVMNYFCDGDVFIFVSGLESASYTFEGESGTYSIDYGDGTCDNIITVTENGETFTIDVGEEYEDFDEDDVD